MLLVGRLVLEEEAGPGVEGNRKTSFSHWSPPLLSGNNRATLGVSGPLPPPALGCLTPDWNVWGAWEGSKGPVLFTKPRAPRLHAFQV